MSSPFSSALANLDDSLHRLHSQLDCLGAALDVDDDRLSHSLRDARHHAATLRDLIRAERPDAGWMDRRTLNQLLQDLEIAAEARNQQRRAKLLDLADELDAGKVKHRFETRIRALDALRLEAIRELRTEAGLSEQLKDLPGPRASEWLPWACDLQEARDAAVLAELRRDFAKVECFAGEMEESYWIPVTRKQESSAKTSQAVGPKPAPATQAFPNSSPQLDADALAKPNQLPQSGRTEYYTTTHTADHDRARSLRYSVGSNGTAPVAKTASDSEGAARGQHAAVAVENDEALFEAIAAGPHVKCCDSCGGSFPAEFHLCPFDNATLRLLAEAVAAVGNRSKHSVPEKIGKALTVAPAREAHLSSPQLAAQHSPTADVLQRAERPNDDATHEAAESEFERLKAILQRNSQDDGGFQLLDQAKPRKKVMVAWVAAAGAVALSVVLALVYHFAGVSASKLRTTVFAVSASGAGVVPDSDIQKDLEQRLAVLKGSSIQATVENGVVTLVGRSPSQWELLHAESLAAQASGVKGVRNQLQVEDANLSTAKSTQHKTKK